LARTKVLIVEDENIVAKDIQRGLEKLGYDVLGTCATGEKAVEDAIALVPDLILMDIMLKGEMTGIEAAENIKSKYSVPIIYLTAYADEDTLNKAKITEPHGYIIKPFKEVDLKTTIEMALYKHKREEDIKKERDLYYSIVENKDAVDCIYVRSKKQLVKVVFKEIYFVEAFKDYIIIHLKDERYIVHSSFKNIISKLPEKEFTRTHKSYHIQLDKIKAIEYPNIIIDHEKKYIPIGITYKKEVMKMLNLL